MIMSIKNLQKKLRHFKNFIFLKRNFFLLMVIGGFAYYSYNHYSGLIGDNARVQIIISVITLAICSLVLLFSLVTALYPYLRFVFKKKVLETNEDEQKDALKILFRQNHVLPGAVSTQLRVPGIRKPFLGFARSRLVFDDFNETEDLLFHRRYKEKNGRSGMIAEKNIWLPNIRDYRIKYGFIFFEDFFNVFSLPYREDKYLGVFTTPQEQEEGALDLATETSEDPVLRVLQHKQARGEMLDYKKYAPGDDVRRIIWKNYARSRELTVRIPDRTFPYVSHINLLVSFYDGSPVGPGAPLKTFILDVFKERIRQVIDTLIEQEFTVRLILDQQIPDNYNLDDYERFLYRISAAQWQTTQPAHEFVRENFPRLQGGSNVLVFSSLCPSSGLETLSGGRYSDLNLVFYNAAETLAKSQPPSILKRILIVDAWEPMAAAKHKSGGRGDHTICA